MAEAAKNGNAKQAAAVDEDKPEPKADPLQATPGMNAGKVMEASPNHLLVPDPLPALDRPIFARPHIGVGHPPIPLHPNQPHPVVEAAIEDLRVRLGEMREFLKRFPHDVGGELGDLVTHLRKCLGVAKADPVRDADRRAEDAHTAARRRDEDAAHGGATPAAVLEARAREDAGLATYRRIQDTPV